jgi:hypothetical protein
MQGRILTTLNRRVIIDKMRDNLERSTEFQSKSSRIEHLDTHSQTPIHEKDAWSVPFPLIPLLQEQQKILRGRFGCHHLYPMH